MAKVIMFEPGLRHLENITKDMAHEAAKLIAADIRSNINNDTGAMSRSVRVRKLKSSSGVYIGTDHWYYNEYGVEPHWIQANAPKRVMRSKKGRWLGRGVMHPGHQAYMPIRRAFFQKRPAATLLIQANGPNDIFSPDTGEFMGFGA